MRSHSASKSLIYVINDLLDLTRTEEGQDLMMDEIFDLSNTIREATSMFKSDTDRKNLSLEIIEYPGLPKLVKGDQSRLRQAVSNIAGNAVKHTDAGGVKIEMWMPEAVGDRCQVVIAIQDTGVGMSPNKLDTLFREFEQVQTDENEPVIPTECGDSSTQPRAAQTFDALSKIPGQKILGLGLAVVARTIRNMNGQLRLKSEEGKGSLFIISLPFTLPSEMEKVEAGSQPLAARESPSRPQSITPPPDRTQNEILLVSSPPQGRPIPIERRSRERRNSSGSMNSLGSQSSGRSEIERIVHAISAPHMSSSPNENSAALRPSTSKSPLPSKTTPVDLRSASPPGPHPLTAPQNQPGQKVIEGSAVPLKAVRIPDESSQGPSREILSGTPTTKPPGEQLKHEEPVKPHPGGFKVLVAEDDPINSKIIKKRMEKLGHEVNLTVNGAECADLFMKQGEEYDIVLMDMQVGIPLSQVLGVRSNTVIPAKMTILNLIPSIIHS